MVIFFFSSRRRHTRFDCDWSSDVCSSDLADPSRIRVDRERTDGGGSGRARAGGSRRRRDPRRGAAGLWRKIGRAACRGRGEISGVAASFKKKKMNSYVLLVNSERFSILRY